MTEGYGSGHGDEGGQRPSGRGAVTERLARQGQGAHEIDLTEDEATRESSGAFEPAAPTADPPAEGSRPGSTSIFDVDERAKQEDLNRTGYEPPLADTEGDADRSEEPQAEAAEITEAARRLVDYGRQEQESSPPLASAAP